MEEINSCLGLAHYKQLLAKKISLKYLNIILGRITLRHELLVFGVYGL